MPHKNLRKLGNRSLVEIAIDCALQSNSFQTIVVTSDSDEILDQAMKRGVIAHKRPDYLAEDDSSMAEVVANLIASNLVPTDYVMLLQPTSPLRESKMISSSLKLLEASNADAVYSMQAIDKKLLKSWVEDAATGHLSPVAGRGSPFSNRQSLGQPFLCDGLIFLFSVRAFNEWGGFPSDNVQKITFDRELSVDIDTLEDFENVRRHFENRK
jgi:CMP-N-acetylneuraminic acid synthetase